MSLGSKKHFWLIGIITVLSIIPLVYTWGKLVIGGDTVIPLDSLSLEKYLYQWLGIQNGEYFSINYYPLYVFYKFFELLHFDIYLLSSVLTFLLSFLAGYGVYKLVRLFSDRGALLSYVVPILFYLFSPALLNGWHYLYIYSAAPWFFYFIFKWVKTQRFEMTDIFWINVVIFFSSLDLPNPKYLFHFFVIAALIMGVGLILRWVKPDFFTKNAFKFFILAISFTYLTLPLFYFVTHYTPEAYGVHIKKGYQDRGVMPDFGSATMDKMMRLHHDGLNLNLDRSEVYTANKLVSFLGYTFMAVILLTLCFRQTRLETRRYAVILLTVIAVYLLFASGSNPPFGALYESLVEKVSVLAFLRTTAGAVLYLSLFYALILFVFLESLSASRNVVATVLISITCIVGYPLLNGEFYQNNSATNQYANPNEYGVRVPEEYFRIESLLNKRKLDAKIFFPKVESSYISTTWGYFGPPLYYFIFHNHVLSSDKVYSDPSLHNIGFVLRDASLLGSDEGGLTGYSESLERIAEEGFLELSEVSADAFLPHLYVPKRTVVSRKDISLIVEKATEDVRHESFAIFGREAGYDLNNTDGVDTSVPGSAQLEFKKVDLTKYRVRFHGARGVFPLVFSEGFHKKWNLYLMPKPQNQTQTGLVESYRVLDGNERDQASQEELSVYLKNGWVTDLGDGQEHRISHETWRNGRESFDYEERYSTDFISKNFQGSIQNDNLPEGRFWETWFKRPLDVGVNHMTVNGYANAWVLDVEKMCRGSEVGVSCIKNHDGTYDFEVVVEFWPQRMAYAGWFVSGLALLLGTFCVVRARWRRRLSFMTRPENTAKMGRSEKKNAV